MKSNAEMIISLVAWKRAAVIDNSVPIPIPNATKPSSPTARNAIMRLKSHCIAAIETLKTIAIIANNTSD